MKDLGQLQDEHQCQTVHTLHADSPTSQQEENRQQAVLDADHSPVDIKRMVDGLDVSAQTKAVSKTTL